MSTIVKATAADIPTIQDVVAKSWPQTYGAILSKEQMAYMIDKMYSDKALSFSIAQNNQAFFLFLEEKTCIGFAGIEHQYHGLDITRLHKLYLVSESQGKGVGKALLLKVIDEAKKIGSRRVSLNVNRHNKRAIEFYQRMTFKIVGEEDIDIGNGYYMNDYMMELTL